MIKVKTAANAMADIGEGRVKTAANVLTPIGEAYSKASASALALLHESRPAPPSALYVDYEWDGDEFVNFIALATPNSKGDGVEYRFEARNTNDEATDSTEWGNSLEFGCSAFGLGSVHIYARSVKDGKHSKTILEVIPFV